MWLFCFQNLLPLPQAVKWKSLPVPDSKTISEVREAFSSLPLNGTLSSSSVLGYSALLFPHPRVASTFVEVQLQDSNDNPPRLTKHESFLTVSEATAPGTLLDQFPATDEDTVSLESTLPYLVKVGMFNYTG